MKLEKLPPVSVVATKGRQSSLTDYFTRNMTGNKIDDFMPSSRISMQYEPK